MSFHNRHSHNGFDMGNADVHDNRNAGYFHTLRALILHYNGGPDRLNSKPGVYVGPENPTGGQRDVRKISERGDAYYGGDFAFDGRAKWMVLGKTRRVAIGQALYKMLDNHNFKRVIRQWPSWVRERIESDVQKLKQTNGDLSWYGTQTSSRGMDGISDIIETLHFAGFSKAIETIFLNHSITLSKVKTRVLQSVPTGDTEKWTTVRPLHHPIQTQATFGA